MLAASTGITRQHTYTKAYLAEEPKPLNVTHVDVDAEQMQTKLNQLCATLETYITEYSVARSTAESALEDMKILLQSATQTCKKLRLTVRPAAWALREDYTDYLKQIRECASKLGLKGASEWSDLDQVFGMDGTLLLMKQELQHRLTRKAVDDAHRVWEQACKVSHEIKQTLGYDPTDFTITDVQTHWLPTEACIDALNKFRLTFEYPSLEAKLLRLTVLRRDPWRAVAGIFWMEPRWMW